MNLKSKVTIITGAIGVLLFSKALGKYIAMPLLRPLLQNKELSALLAGLLLLGIAFLLYRSVFVLAFNKRRERLVLENTPKTIQDIAEAGVCNPVDFCVLMQASFSYSKTPNLGLPYPYYVESRNKEAWDRAIELFCSYFGRAPYGLESSDPITWSYLAAYEAEHTLNKGSVSELTEDDMLQLLSPNIKELLFDIPTSPSTTRG